MSDEANNIGDAHVDRKTDWRVVPMDIHGWSIFDKDNAEVVSNIYREEIAAQIVSEHNSIPALRAALYEARGLACEQTWTKIKADAARANKLVAQIDAALALVNKPADESAKRPISDRGTQASGV